MSAHDPHDDAVDHSAAPTIRVSNISPLPSDDVVAAITVAVLEAWPKPVSADPRPPATDLSWRFGQRRWRERVVPRRTWGR